MNLTDWWRAHYDDGVPVAHILRNQIPDRWLRIHSLPESKRYPETAQEYAIMLARHRAVAEDVLGTD